MDCFPEEAASVARLNRRKLQEARGSRYNPPPARFSMFHEMEDGRKKAVLVSTESSSRLIRESWEKAAVSTETESQEGDLFTRGKCPTSVVRSE